MSPANGYEAMSCCLVGLGWTTRLRFGTNVLVAATASAQIFSRYVANAVSSPPAFGPRPFNGGIVTAPLADDLGRVALQIENAVARVLDEIATRGAICSMRAIFCVWTPRLPI